MASIRMETITDVRPEDGGPEISVMAPRGSPPVSASRGAIPVGTLSQTRRSGSVNGDGTRSLKADSNRARAERERDSAKPSWMRDCIKSTETTPLYPNIRTVVNRMPKRIENTAAPLIPSNPTIPKLRAAATDCRACDLWKRGTQTVFGEGGSKARVMLVGEQPGDQEDIQGRPFVGP